MKYAIIRTGGKQYRVSEGDVIEVERLSDAVDQKINFSDVLLYTADGATQIGQPIVSGVTVQAKVLEHTKGDKLRVAKFKAKARYRRVTGHRQSLTKVMIESISGGKKTEKPVEAAQA